jgi:hypothetical protein
MFTACAGRLPPCRRWTKTYWRNCLMICKLRCAALWHPRTLFCSLHLNLPGFGCHCCCSILQLPLQVRQGLVALGGRHMQQEGFCTDEDDRSNDAWDAVPWLAHDADTGTVDTGGGRALAWPADVEAAAPPKVLEFLRDCSASDGCQLLDGWAAADLPGLDPPADAHGSGAVAAGSRCSCSRTAEEGLCTKHAAWRNLCQVWAGSFVDANLEALQQILRCMAQLAQRHAELAPAGTAVVTLLQRQVSELHGSQLRLQGVFQ